MPVQPDPSQIFIRPQQPVRSGIPFGLQPNTRTPAGCQGMAALQPDPETPHLTGLLAAILVLAMGAEIGMQPELAGAGMTQPKTSCKIQLF